MDSTHTIRDRSKMEGAEIGMKNKKIRLALCPYSGESRREREKWGGNKEMASSHVFTIIFFRYFILVLKKNVHIQKTLFAVWFVFS